MDAQSLDATDALAHFRSRFVIADEGLVYLKGNSLGRLPRAAQEALRRQVDAAWGDRLVRAWNEGWYDAPERIGGKIAGLIGAKPHECIVAGSTSENLYSLLTCALRARSDRNVIVTDDLNFPSDLYVMQGLPAEVRVVRTRNGSLDLNDLANALDERVAVVSLSLVAFRSGFRVPLMEVAELCRSVGAWQLWDLSHATGAIQVDLGAAGAEMAVGCTYKYLNGGPGAPAFLYVREDLIPQLEPPVQGWFGHASPFQFDLDYRPAEGIRRFLAGTPPILSLLAIEAGVDLCLEAGMAAIEDKGARLTDYAQGLLQDRYVIETPRNPKDRGAHITIVHPQAFALSRALIDRGVVVDFREPDALRMGFSPLYTRFSDVEKAVATLDEIVERGIERIPDRPAVT